MPWASRRRYSWLVSTGRTPMMQMHYRDRSACSRVVRTGVSCIMASAPDVGANPSGGAS
jgi:hypothetical protein